MNICYVVRFSRPAGLFSFSLLDGPQVRLRRPYLREAPAGSPLRPSPYCWGLAPFFLAPVPVLGTGQAPLQTAEPVPWPPRAGLATRLSDFATNRHE
jgi:hypothetical protein